MRHQTNRGTRIAWIVIFLSIASASAAGQAPASEHTFIPVLHSVSYAGVWRGQAQLSVDQFLVKAKELGFSHVEIMAKRPHLNSIVNRKSIVNTMLKGPATLI